MKFPHLPVGSRFELDGVQYVKTGPLTASEVEGGGQRLIKRSAVVMPLEPQAPGGKPPEAATDPLPREKVDEALQAYQQQMDALFEAGGNAAYMREQLHQAYVQLRQRLGL